MFFGSGVVLILGWPRDVSFKLGLGERHCPSNWLGYNMFNPLNELAALNQKLPAHPRLTLLHWEMPLLFFWRACNQIGSEFLYVRSMEIWGTMINSQCSATWRSTVPAKRAAV